MRSSSIREEDVENFVKHLSKKHKLIFEIGCSTGLRISDIVRLKVGDILKEKPTIKEQKTGKGKRIYIKKNIKKEILKQCNISNADEYVFKSNSSAGHISRQAVFKAFKKASKKSNIDYNIATHSMRKSYAHKLLKKGKNFKYIQGKLNHTSQADTLTYIINEGDIK